MTTASRHAPRHRALALAACLLCLARAACAHEFWIEPARFTLEDGERVSATLRVGERMSGYDIPYLTHEFQSFTVSDRSTTRAVEGNEGDSPALAYDPAAPGLQLVAYHSSLERLHYGTWEKFTRFLDYEGLDGIAERHRARGLATTGFVEAYVRYAKSLVQVGPVQGDDVDRPLGLELELVVDRSPYVPSDEPLPVRVLWQGAPIAGIQLSVFHHAGEDGEVVRTVLRSDRDGQVGVPLEPGHRYLLNAVHMEAVEDAETVWLSHWASITFQSAR